MKVSRYPAAAAAAAIYHVGGTPSAAFVAPAQLQRQNHHRNQPVARTVSRVLITVSKSCSNVDENDKNDGGKRFAAAAPAASILASAYLLSSILAFAANNAAFADDDNIYPSSTENIGDTTAAFRSPTKGGDSTSRRYGRTTIAHHPKNGANVVFASEYDIKDSATSGPSSFRSPTKGGDSTSRRYREATIAHPTAVANPRFWSG